MKVGDLVRDNVGDIGIITGIRYNGDCYVQYADDVYLVSTKWLEVIS